MAAKTKTYRVNMLLDGVEVAFIVYEPNEKEAKLRAVREADLIFPSTKIAEVKSIELI